jgi:putative oxidoreductase
MSHESTFMKRALTGGFADLVRTLLGMFVATGHAVTPPVLRIALALPFFRSGLTRWDGFLLLKPSTLYLFEEEFKLHIFGNQYAFPAPDVVAQIVAIAEITLPVLLVLGFATRWTALALLVMTGVIQLVVPEGWANFHLYWAAIALAIIALGPGPLSLDRLIFGRNALRTDAASGPGGKQRT